MEFADITSAEIEATEVLHSLLSVPRVQNCEPKQETPNDIEKLNYLSSEDILTSGDTSEHHAPDETIVSTTDIDGTSNDIILKKKLVKRKTNKNTDKTNKIEDDAEGVRSRFLLGCDCTDNSCFTGLNPESVYRHRLNIAELTKEEHDMYLMGLTMACLCSTSKRSTRQRLHSTYVYRGRKVCLSAFLYLENCTYYQLKVIRKHLSIHGVAPRVHGNHGKKPHNVFSLEIYRRATDFLREFFQKYPTSSGNMQTVVLPADISVMTIHKEYEAYVRQVAPSNEKLIGYSSFKIFIKKQFPNVRFCKPDGRLLLNCNKNAPSTSRITN